MRWSRSSIDEPGRPPAPVEYLLVGQIGSAHGLGGEASVRVLSENKARFAPGSRLLAGSDPNRSRLVEVERVRLQSGRALVKFAGVHDRTGAESLRGSLLFVPSDDVPEPEADAYWEHQLTGARVVDVQGAELGFVTGIEERLDQDVWKVATPSGPVLVPAAKEIIISVELDAGRIVVDPPPGLFEEGEPTR